MCIHTKKLMAVMHTHYTHTSHQALQKMCSSNPLKVLKQSTRTVITSLNNFCTHVVALKQSLENTRNYVAKIIRYYVPATTEWLLTKAHQQLTTI